MNEQQAAVNAMLEGHNASESIYNSVDDSQQELLDSNNAHHSRIMGDQYEISGDSHLQKAADEMRTGGSSWEELEAANSRPVGK